jgi:response regulator NasT
MTTTTSAPDAPRRLILLVDDDAILLDYLSTILRHAGHDTLEATSAPEALQRVAEREADIGLALLDINMPGMSGLDLAQRLREHTSVPFMIKPVDAARLLPAFESALARADEIRQLRRTEANLNAALAAGRETSLAVGLLMARYQADRNTAFEVLRDHARASRRKINEVAEQLVAAEELLNGLHGAFAARLRK